MTQKQTLKRLERAHWRRLEGMLKQAYQDGLEAGRARAHGQSRRGRAIRADATVEGMLRLIERHFGLDRYRFDLLVVHRGSKIRVPAADLIGKYLDPER